MKFLIAAAALGSLAIPASAEEVRFEVEYADLNLQSAKGQKALDRRIEAAARKACGYNARITGTRLQSRDARDCVAELTAKAHKQFAATVANTGKGG